MSRPARRSRPSTTATRSSSSTRTARRPKASTPRSSIRRCRRFVLARFPGYADLGPGQCGHLSERGRNGEPMASSESTVKAPDGRVWSITTSRRRRSFKESGKVPYFWAHLIVTTIMVLVFLLILKSDVFKILSVFIVLVFLVWLAGFLNSLFRVTI